jgi:hypothetical protein
LTPKALKQGEEFASFRAVILRALSRAACALRIVHLRAAQ